MYSITPDTLYYFNFVATCIPIARLDVVITISCFISDIVIQSLIVLLLLADLPLPSVCTYRSGMLICNSHMNYLGDLSAYPASSCQQVCDLRSDAKSGYYWIQDGCCLAKVY